MKTAIKVLKKAKNPVIDKLQIPQFLNGKDWCMIICKNVVLFPGADPEKIGGGGGLGWLAPYIMLVDLCRLQSQIHPIDVVVQGLPCEPPLPPVLLIYVLYV